MKLMTLSTVLFLMVSPFANAHHERGEYYGKHYGKQQRHSIKARVVKSTPVYKYIRVRDNHHRCEPVHNRRHHQSQGKNAALVGGVVGGVVGHAVSNNRHKGLGTVMGAVIGGTLVHKLGHVKRKHYYSETPSSHCRVRHNTTKKVRVLDGYNVTYRSRGQLYQTYMQDKPKKFIRIYS